MNEKARVLVVEDEEDILALVQFNLSRHGYQVETAVCGEEALEKVSQFDPQLLVLDLMLPGIDGLEICRRLREETATAELPVIMLTACGEEDDIIRGFELGADDYVTKPFSIKVLLARVESVLRRKAARPQNDTEEIVRGELRIHPGRKLVQVAGQTVDLTYTEFGVLHALASRPGWVFTRYQIVNLVRGEDYAVTDRAVDVQIAGLRKKLGACGACIETVRGTGYRFRDEPLC